MPDYLTLAIVAAREAGALLREGFGQATRVEHKGAIDLVTDYDRQAEALILARLRAAFPEHAINAEESGRTAGSAREWLVDPLDGTTNFAHGFPQFAVSLALTEHGRLTVGVVYDPLRDELFAARSGQGATLNGAAIRVSAVRSLDQALLTTGFPYDIRTNPRNNLAEFTRFQLRCQAVRRPGAAALDCAWVAAGRADGYWELRVSPWDVAAGALIAREAGGRVTSPAGGDDFLGQDAIVVSNGLIHAEMLAVLRDE
ncbi:MAG: inositol monophosphatase [Anaerolineales bacterium]|nr:inositol monophosphatase [Anaerolineales bacterium]